MSSFCEKNEYFGAQYLANTGTHTHILHVRTVHPSAAILCTAHLNTTRNTPAHTWHTYASHKLSNTVYSCQHPSGPKATPKCICFFLKTTALSCWPGHQTSMFPMSWPRSYPRGRLAGNREWMCAHLLTDQRGNPSPRPGVDHFHIGVCYPLILLPWGTVTEPLDKHADACKHIKRLLSDDCKKKLQRFSVGSDCFESLGWDWLHKKPVKYQDINTVLSVWMISLFGIEHQKYLGCNFLYL